MERRHDLDWLRIVLFAILVPHHAAVGFVGFGEPIYGFVNDRLGGGLLELAIYWSHGWRLPSLFLIAGIGTWFATRRDAGPGWVAGRAARLLVPAAFGAIVLNAAAAAVIGAILGAPLPASEFWLDRFPAPARVMHLWFLVNLAIYTFILWPFFQVRDRLSELTLPASTLVGAIVAVVTLIPLAVKPHAAAVAGEGYQFWWYLGVFAGGWLIGARHAEALDWARRRRRALLLAGVGLFAAEVAILDPVVRSDPVFGNALAEGGWAAAGLAPAYGLRTLAFTAVEKLGAWAWCLAALGFAAHWLNRPGPRLDALTRAIFPFYVLHFPVILIGLALLARVPWPWELELLSLIGAGYAVTAALYLAALRSGPLIGLVGGRRGT
jgi:hypothetical protein